MINVHLGQILMLVYVIVLLQVDYYSLGNIKLISSLALYGKKFIARYAKIILLSLKKVDARKGIFFLFYPIVVETLFYERFKWKILTTVILPISRFFDFDCIVITSLVPSTHYWIRTVIIYQSKQSFNSM